MMNDTRMSEVRPTVFSGLLDTVASRLGLRFDEGRYPQPRQWIQARIVFAFQLAYASTWLAYVLLYAALGSYISAGICLFVGTLPSVIGIALLRSGHRVETVGLLSNVGSATALFLLTFTTGGAGSAIIVWLLAVVVGTYLQLGKRLGHKVSAYIFTLVVMTWLLDAQYGHALYGLPFPEGTAWFLSYNYAFAIFISALIISIFAGQFEDGYVALQEAEQRYRLLLNHLPVGVFHYDDKLIITYCNQRFADILNNSVDRLVGLDMKTLEDQSIIPALNNALAGKLGYFEGHYDATLSEASIEIEMTCTPSMNSKGEMKGGIAIVQDITVRKRAEMAVMQSRAELQQAQRIARVGNWQLDLRTNHVLWSEELYRMQGLDPRSSPPDYTESAKLFTPESWELLSASIARTAESGTPYELELEMVKPDASHGWMLARGEAIRNEADAIVGVRGVAMEITERKLAEALLKLSDLVYQHSSEAMLVTDADNRIVAINPAFTEVTGYAADEVIGKTPKVLNSGRHNAAFYQAMWNSISNTGCWRGEIWNRRKNGEVYAELLTINTIYTQSGSVHRRVALFSDITEKKDAEALILDQANFDQLTRLPNRRLFHDRLEQEIKKAQREDMSTALLFIDLDRFKDINDTLGHDVGDLLLIEAAQRIKSCVRAYDTVARLGGDEFTVILAELAEPSDIGRIAQNIIDTLSQPFLINDRESFVSASIGIALYPEDAVTLSDLLKNADQAMYQAKQDGRGRYHFFTKTMQEASEYRTQLADDLRRALDKKQLEVYYQPIVNLVDNTISKAEALLRWNHPEKGRISPAIFIPIAEDTGTIHEIGDWVFMQGAMQAKKLTSELGRDFQISVNQSPVQISNNRHPQRWWNEKLAELELSGRNIVMEITEGLLMDDNTRVAENLLLLRNANIQVAIDDFGTGYSALSYLKKFDIDYLKIDQSFIRNLALETEDFALCEAIVVMAHKLGLKVIAEGVETEQQRDLLKQIGCDYAQGYLFSRPVPVDEFEALLRQFR